MSMLRTSLLPAIILSVLVTSSSPAQIKPPFRPPGAPGRPAPSAAADPAASLLQRLRSDDAGARTAALERLAELGGLLAASAQSELVKALGDQSGHVRQAALSALAALGRDAGAALPAVQEHFRTAETDYERTLAARAAVAISSDRKAVADMVPALIAGLAATDPITADESAAALTSLGRVAHTPLTEALGNSDATTAARIVEILGNGGARSAVGEIGARLGSDDASLRAAAASSLGNIGPAAADVASGLVELLKNDESPVVREQAAGALGRIGTASDESAAALAAALDDEDASVAAAAIEALIEVSDGSTLGEMLPELLTDQRVSVVSAAMAALADKGTASAGVLKEALKDPRSRPWAAMLIADLGPQAAEFTPELIDLLADSHPAAQREALIALGNLADKAKAATPQITPLVQHEQAGVRYAAILALGRIGQSTSAVRERLRGAASTDDPMQRALSAWARLKLETNPLERVRSLRELAEGLKSNRSDVRRMTAQCLAELRPGPQQLPMVLANLREALESDDEQLRETLIRSVGEVVRPHASRFLAPLLKNPVTRPLGARVAADLRVDVSDARRPLLQALRDPRPEVRRDAALGLSGAAAESSDVINGLAAVLRSDDVPAVRRAAISALAQAGATARGAVPALKAALEDQTTNSEAARALALVAPGDQQSLAGAMKQLIADLESDDPEHRFQSARTLERLGATASAAAPALKYATEDPDPLVRAAARAALAAAGGE